MRETQDQFRPRFYVTDAAPCPYLAGRKERKIFTHLIGQNADALNNELTQIGFRRSQMVAYRPVCDGCTACRSVRVKVDKFKPSPSLRRILNKNANLQAEIRAPQATREQYALLRRYLDARHSEGGMSDMTEFDYVTMVEDTAVTTRLVEYRAAGALYACVLVDQMDDGLSLVYSFFDPTHGRRSLGSYIILDQIAHTRMMQLPYLYLGYLVSGSEKMAYKQRFRPLEILIDHQWQDM